MSHSLPAISSRILSIVVVAFRYNREVILFLLLIVFELKIYFFGAWVIIPGLKWVIVMSPLTCEC